MAKIMKNGTVYSVGARGATGPQGPQGVQGPVGPRGASVFFRDVDTDHSGDLRSVFAEAGATGEDITFNYYDEDADEFYHKTVNVPSSGGGTKIKHIEGYIGSATGELTLGNLTDLTVLSNIEFNAYLTFGAMINGSMVGPGASIHFSVNGSEINPVYSDSIDVAGIAYTSNLGTLLFPITFNFKITEADTVYKLVVGCSVNDVARIANDGTITHYSSPSLKINNIKGNYAIV